MKKENIFIHNADKNSRTLILFTDLSEELIALIEKEIEEPLHIIAFKEIDWNRDFSPWAYEKFSGEGGKTIEEALKDVDKEVLVAGYSLGGLLSLYASTLSDRITGIASVSGSLWYPGLIEYLNEHPIHNRNIYLSLGNKEPRTKHPLMKTVGEKTEEVRELLEKDNQVFFEWNEGNHFFEADQRLIKGIRYLLEKEKNNERKN